MATKTNPRMRRLALVALVLAAIPADGFAGGAAAPLFSRKACGAQRPRFGCARLAYGNAVDGGWSNAEIARAFTQSDKSGSGKLDDDEVRAALRAMGSGVADRGEVEQALQACDFNGSGRMELGEW